MADKSGPAVAARAPDLDRTDIGGWSRCVAENNHGIQYSFPAAVWPGAVQVATLCVVDGIETASATGVEQHLPLCHVQEYLV